MVPALCLAAFALPILGASVAHHRAATITSLSFEAFVREHGRDFSPGSREYERRRALFEAHVARVEEVNRAGGSWRASVNRLADRTPSELNGLRGYRRIGGGDKGKQPVQFLGRHAEIVAPPNLSALPDSFSWAGKLNATTDIQDQGQCGSCWAVSSATVLRAHSELYRGVDRRFAVQQIVSCASNPLNCGGTGGCDGATAELAMDYVMRSGCVAEADYPYTEAASKCPAHMTSKQTEPHPTYGGVVSNKYVASFSQLGGHSQGVDKSMAGMQFGMMGWNRLPENQLAPVLHSLFERGPLVISLHAGSEWNLYENGILDSCKPDAVIDHAVMLVGYGADPALENAKYWTIQNSWGKNWGEAGFLRFSRHDHEEEQAYCGWDEKPEIGSGCSDGPSKVWICGHCGFLNDAVQPNFALRSSGWLARHSAKAS